MEQEEWDALQSCVDCHANIEPGLDRAYMLSDEICLCFSCAIRRGGKAVIVGVARPTDSAGIRPMGMVFEEKAIQGSYFGSCVPRVDFPRMLQLYMAGKLKLDELITRRYRIDEAPQAFADLESGKNARGVIIF